MIFAALNSVFSLAYYAPMVNRMFRREPSHAVLSGNPMGGLMGLPLLVLTVFTIAVGIWPSLVTWLSEPAGASLLAAFGL